jgi:hypothetical protein
MPFVLIYQISVSQYEYSYMSFIEHLQTTEFRYFFMIFFKHITQILTAFALSLQLTSLAVSSVVVAAAHNHNDVTPPPFHLSVCWHSITASDSAFQYEMLWKNHGPVGLVSLFCLTWTMVNWCQPYQTLSITNRDSRDQAFSFLLFLSRISHILLGVLAKLPRETILLYCSISVYPCVCTLSVETQQYFG